MSEIKREKLGKRAKDVARKVESQLSINQTVDEAINQIRLAHATDKGVVYFYVVDERGKLLGTVNTRELLISSPETPLRKIVNTKIKTLQSHHTVYEGLMLMQKYHLLALPVVENGRLVGVLDIQTYFDESVELNTAKKRQEVFQTLGIILDEGPKQSVWVKYRTRMPWILCNMIGGIVCAIISDFYEIVLLKVIVLAMFIPLVLSLSESISMQSMTQSMYQIGKYNAFWKEAFKYLYQEAKLFILISITCGVLVGGLSLLWGDGWGPGPVIAISIIISILVTAIIGALVPLILHTWKLDPKIASGPIVLMFADIITTSIYLGLAFIMLIGF